MIAAIRHLWLALLPLFWIGAAGACQICIPLPERTLADRLLDSDAVVLAREDASRPFHYQAVETLFGEPGDAPIDLFLHSQARRVLAADPQRAMVHDLIAWRRWDFAVRIREIRQDLAADPLAAYALGLYLRLATAKDGSVPLSRASGATHRSLADEPA